MDVITQRGQLIDAIRELNRAFHLDENTPFPETAELLTRMFENFNDILLEDYKSQVLTEGVYMIDDNSDVISLDGSELPSRARARQSNNPYRNNYKSAVGIVRGNSKMHLVGRGASFEAQYMALPIIMNNTIDSLEKLKSRLRDHDSKKLSNLIYKLTNMLGDIYDFGADLVGNTYERDLDICKGLDIMLESCLRIDEKVDALSRLDESYSPYKYDMLLESLLNENDELESFDDIAKIVQGVDHPTDSGEQCKGEDPLVVLSFAFSSAQTKTIFRNLLRIIREYTTKLQGSIDNLCSIVKKNVSLQAIESDAQKLSQAFELYTKGLVKLEAFNTL